MNKGLTDFISRNGAPSGFTQRGRMHGAVGSVKGFFSRLTVWKVTGHLLFLACLCLITVSVLYVIQDPTPHSITLGCMWSLVGVLNIMNLINGGVFDD